MNDSRNANLTRLRASTGANARPCVSRVNPGVRFHDATIDFSGAGRSLTQLQTKSQACVTTIYKRKGNLHGPTGKWPRPSPDSGEELVSVANVLGIYRHQSHNAGMTLLTSRVALALCVLAGCGGTVVTVPSPDAAGGTVTGADDGSAGIGGGGEGTGTGVELQAGENGQPAPGRSEVVLIDSDSSARVVANPPLVQPNSQDLWVESSNLTVGPDENASDASTVRWFGQVRNVGVTTFCNAEIYLKFMTAQGFAFSADCIAEGSHYLQEGAHVFCLAPGEAGPAYYSKANMQVPAAAIQSVVVDYTVTAGVYLAADSATPFFNGRNTMSTPNGYVLEGIGKGSATATITNVLLSFYPDVDGFLVDRITATRDSLVPNELWSFDTTPSRGAFTEFLSSAQFNVPSP